MKLVDVMGKVSKIIMVMEDGSAAEYSGEDAEYISIVPVNISPECIEEIDPYDGGSVKETYTPTRQGRLVHFETGPTCGECFFVQVAEVQGAGMVVCKLMDPDNGRLKGTDLPLKKRPFVKALFRGKTSELKEMLSKRHADCPAPEGLWAWGK